MKIDCKDFRVREGDKVHLEKWPTKVDPVYKSKHQYEKSAGRARRQAQRNAATSLRVRTVTPYC